MLRIDEPDWSTVTCPCGSSLRWSWFDAYLNEWIEIHAGHVKGDGDGSKKGES